MPIIKVIVELSESEVLGYLKRAGNKRFELWYDHPLRTLVEEKFKNNLRPDQKVIDFDFIKDAKPITFEVCTTNGIDHPDDLVDYDVSVLGPGADLWGKLDFTVDDYEYIKASWLLIDLLKAQRDSGLMHVSEDLISDDEDEHDCLDWEDHNDTLWSMFFIK